MSMKRHLWSLFSAMWACAFSAQAQVDKVAIRTTGVSCGSCAVFSEIYLRQLSGIDTIKISLSREAVLITYKPGAAFRPKELREALRKTDVGVVQIQIGARGHLERRRDGATLVAGQTRLNIQSAPAGLPIPPDVPIEVEGILNDLTNPMELRVLTFRPVTATQ